MFLPKRKIKSVFAHDLAEKVGSSNLIYLIKISVSHSLVLQDLMKQICEEVTDSLCCSLSENVDLSNVVEGLSATIAISPSANLVASDAKSQGALSLTKDAALNMFGLETLLKADIVRGGSPQYKGAESSVRIHTTIQNDSYFVEDPQGQAESDGITMDDGPDPSAVVASQRVAELQKEVRHSKAVFVGNMQFSSIIARNGIICFYFTFCYFPDM